MKLINENDNHYRLMITNETITNETITNETITSETISSETISGGPETTGVGAQPTRDFFVPRDSRQKRRTPTSTLWRHRAKCLVLGAWCLVLGA